MNIYRLWPVCTGCQYKFASAIIKRIMQNPSNSAHQASASERLLHFDHSDIYAKVFQFPYFMARYGTAWLTMKDKSLLFFPFFFFSLLSSSFFLFHSFFFVLSRLERHQNQRITTCCDLQLFCGQCTHQMKNVRTEFVSISLSSSYVSLNGILLQQQQQERISLIFLIKENKYLLRSDND